MSDYDSDGSRTIVQKMDLPALDQTKADAAAPPPPPSPPPATTSSSLLLQQRFEPGPVQPPLPPPGTRKKIKRIKCRAFLSRMFARRSNLRQAAGGVFAVSGSSVPPTMFYPPCFPPPALPPHLTGAPPPPPLFLLQYHHHHHHHPSPPGLPPPPPYFAVSPPQQTIMYDPATACYSNQSTPFVATTELMPDHLSCSSAKMLYPSRNVYELPAYAWACSGWYK